MEISDIIFYIAEVIGLVAFAVSGAMIAIDRKLDLFGIVLITFVNSFGGGLTRDIIIGEIPPKMFYNYEYLIYVAICAIVVIAVVSILKERFFRNRVAIDKVINIFDAVGLGAFAIVGVKSGLNAGFGDNGFFCVFLGMTTGIGGGILRDLLSHAKPLVLVKQIYALAAIIGGLLFYYLQIFNVNYTLSLVLSVLLVVVIRILAAHFRWDLPKVADGVDKKYK